VDDGGLGGGVTDRLKELGEPVIPINAGSSAVGKTEDGREAKQRFVNRRSQMWWTGRELLRSGELLLEGDDILESQLSDVKYGYDSQGRIKIESKEDMEKRRDKINEKGASNSPDRADALLLAFAPADLSSELDSVEDIAF
jgi:hypothetical protein